MRGTKTGRRGPANSQRPVKRGAELAVNQRLCRNLELLALLLVVIGPLQLNPNQPGSLWTEITAIFNDHRWKNPPSQAHANLLAHANAYRMALLRLGGGHELQPGYDQGGAPTTWVRKAATAASN